MRVLIGALLLGLCAWQTHTRAQVWRSDEALWRSAQLTAPQVPQVAFNLGAALVHEGRWAEAADAFLTASHLSSAGRGPFNLQRQAGLGLSFIDTVGTPICDVPRFASACVWVSP